MQRGCDDFNTAPPALPRPPPSPLVTPRNCTTSLLDCLQVMPEVLRNSGKRPRREQLEAYRRGLLNDTIVVLATGAGKTFIASMVGGWCMYPIG